MLASLWSVRKRKEKYWVGGGAALRYGFICLQISAPLPPPRNVLITLSAGEAKVSHNNRATVSRGAGVSPARELSGGVPHLLPISLGVARYETRSHATPRRPIAAY